MQEYVSYIVSTLEYALVFKLQIASHYIGALQRKYFEFRL